MKKFIILNILLIFCILINAQTASEKLKIETDIKKLVAEYQVDFKNIRGKLKDSLESELIYYSKVKLFGTIDSTNLIRYNSVEKKWSFHADIDVSVFDDNNAHLKIIRNINFPFGKLKGIASGVEWIAELVPANKKTAGKKLKELTIWFWMGYMREKGDNGYNEVSIKIFGYPYNQNK